MINNRQGGRRRGRGGQRTPNLSGRPDGNRQDNRQRGNAAQLLEKYKSMARDAQLAGDRVQTEYFLQYADHYYRVLGESRARFEEQRRQHGDDQDDEGDEDMLDADDQQDQVEQRETREQRDRPQRQRPHISDDQRADGDRPRRERRPRDDRDEPARARPAVDEQRIAFEALPPAIGASARESGRDSAPEHDDQPDGDSEDAPRPRRRARRPRTEDSDGDIAPAA